MFAGSETHGAQEDAPRQRPPGRDAVPIGGWCGGLRTAFQLVVICAALTATSVADAAPDSGGLRSGAEWIRQGNAHLAAGAYAKALAAFDKAREVLPDSAEAAYDRGIALFRLGRFDEAETAFQDALASAKPALEAAAKYNLGRSAHQAAIQRERTSRPRSTI
ncbi:MAG: tetratricopeptide repeat protein [Phycisphaerae bacterium]